MFDPSAPGRFAVRGGGGNEGCGESACCYLRRRGTEVRRVCAAARLQKLIFFSASETPVTAAKILQPKDTHIFSVEGNYTVTGVGGFKSTSEHLFNGQQLLERSVHTLGLSPFRVGRSPGFVATKTL